MKFKKTGLVLWLLIFCTILLAGCDYIEELNLNNSVSIDGDSTPDAKEEINDKAEKKDNQKQIKEDGIYTSPKEVADYLHLYNKLPDNFITKKEAAKLGWNSKEGNLDEACPGKSIGGDRFGNREGLLPESDNRKWFECDVNYQGGYRGGERIVYSNDGLIYYSKDHYNNFELLYSN